MSATATYEEVNKGCFDDLVYILTQINHIDLQSRVFEVTQKLNYIPENTLIPQLTLFAKEACEDEIEFINKFVSEILHILFKFKTHTYPMYNFFFNYIGEVENIYNSMGRSGDGGEYTTLAYQTITNMFARVHLIIEDKLLEAQMHDLISDNISNRTIHEIVAAKMFEEGIYEAINNC